MTNLWEIALLAVTQGITEFLPISSSGHLALLSKILSFAPETTVELVVALHAGTLLSILVYYFKDLINLLTSEGLRFIPKIIVATIPAGVVGGAIHMCHLTETIFTNTLIPGLGLLVTGAMLFYAADAKRDKKYPLYAMRLYEAFLVGLAQCLAILPGVSRSGTTISSALRTGMDSKDAATFSFFLAIPVIAGAALIETLSKFRGTGFTFSVSISHLVIGFALAAVVGYISIAFLIKVIKKSKLNYFAYYCFFIGTIITCWGIYELLFTRGA